MDLVNLKFYSNMAESGEQMAMLVRLTSILNGLQRVDFTVSLSRSSSDEWSESSNPPSYKNDEIALL